MLQSIAKDFKEFVALLNANGVDYLLIGGYAVSHYGFTRATNDIDIWVGISPENAKRLVKAIRDFGMPFSPEDESRFLSPGAFYWMGYHPFRIELVNQISGVDFYDCYQRMIVTDIDGIPVKIISLEDLKINKKASARPKDILDLHNLP